MDRYINYAGQIPLETDLLNSNRNAMVALAKLSSALFGSNTIVSGLACTPTTVPSMSVNVAPGEIYALASLDATAYSSLAADTTHQVCKQGLSLDQQTFALTAPVTGGYSVCYLIQAQFQENDTSNVVLPYYNASNPQTAWSGPNNTGASQATERKGQAVVQAKSGVAAATGTQVPPAADAGFVPLYVVTVAYGQTTITAANIAMHPQAPIIPTSVVGALQGNAFNYALDTGTANAYAANYAPAVTTLTDGMDVWFKAKNTNTGNSTLSVNGSNPSPILGATQLQLAANTILANGQYQVVWNAGLSAWVLCNAGTSGGLTNITAQAPLTSTGGATPTLGMPAANATTDGYLSHVDWGTFNSKGTVSTVSIVPANGVSGAVANANTTPAITITLGAITPSSVTTVALTCTTMNATASDRRLKTDIRKVDPRPLHRALDFVGYRWRKGGSGLGVIAQQVAKVEPLYVGTFELDGKPRLSVDKQSIAYEQAMWAGHEVDRQAKVIAQLLKRIERLEAKR